MAFEGAQMVPVYDMNKSDGDGFMGGGAGWMWVVMLFFLLAWGGGFGGFGGNGANGAVNTLTNEFLYTNLNNTIDRGFNQLANQNFVSKKISANLLVLYKWVCVKDSIRLMLQSQKVALLHSNAAAKLIAILMLFVQKTTRTLVKSLLQFMQKLKQLVL